MGARGGLSGLIDLGLNPLYVASNFPYLAPSNHQRISDPTDNYNCISHAYGIDNRRMWPMQAPRYWWPAGVRNDEHVDAFVDLFVKIGYKVCQTAEFEVGFEKVAIYTTDGPTHAARQLPSGHWTSKLGNLADIEHDTLDNINGPLYGSAVRFLRRPRAASA